MEQVILVNENDEEVGIGEKIEVHREAKLHRAFSIFVFNFNGDLMLQKRAASKYHAGGLWTNTCCGHPSPDEDLEKAAHRRLIEEMGFDCEMSEKLSFIYNVSLDNNMREHEYLHVFMGNYENEPELNPEEAEDWKWVSSQELEKDISENPSNYTPWFLLSLPKVMEHMNSKKI